MKKTLCLFTILCFVCIPFLADKPGLVKISVATSTGEPDTVVKLSDASQYILDNPLKSVASPTNTHKDFCNNSASCEDVSNIICKYLYFNEKKQSADSFDSSQGCSAVCGSYNIELYCPKKVYL